MDSATALLHALAVAFLASHRGALLSARSQGTTAAELPVTLAALGFLLRWVVPGLIAAFVLLGHAGGE